jgi:hypothetical protein
MDNLELLRLRAAEFRKLLQQAERTDPGLSKVLVELEPLFEAIAQGSLKPPLPFRTYRPKFNSEDSRYGMNTPIFSAESDFNSALEDWPSKAWYQA